MKSKSTFNKQRIQIGTSSLLLIFTVLCLVVFSTLSLASAKADYALAAKNEKSVKIYYDADAKGEELKKDINRKMIDLAVQALNKNQFKELMKQSFKEAFNDEDNSISYTIDAGSQQFLFIQLRLSNYEEIAEGKQNYKVMSWIIQNKVDYAVDNNMPVWSGI
nr:hypothetical protein [uncultured Aminipila sp.]